VIWNRARLAPGEKTVPRLVPARMFGVEALGYLPTLLVMGLLFFPRGAGRDMSIRCRNPVDTNRLLATFGRKPPEVLAS